MWWGGWIIRYRPSLLGMAFALVVFSLPPPPAELALDLTAVPAECPQRLCGAAARCAAAIPSAVGESGRPSVGKQADSSKFLDACSPIARASVPLELPNGPSPLGVPVLSRDASPSPSPLAPSGVIGVVAAALGHFVGAVCFPFLFPSLWAWVVVDCAEGP
eukprot:6492131-Amphidinium_carterae.2